MTKPDLALVGAGYWGKNLARNFLSLDALHTICDSNEDTLASYGEEYSEVQRETSFAKVLAEPEIQKIAIAAPAHLHYELGRQAIEAGKDVYVEKPLCLSIDQAQDLIALAKSSQRILMVGHLLQYHPCVEKLVAMVLAGELGRLCYITSNRLNLGKVRQEENSLWSFAPHDISVILALAGEMPDSVTCTGNSYLTPGVADTTLTHMTFRNGLQGHVYVSWLNPFKEQKLTVVGSEGMAVFDDTKPWDQKLILYRDYLKWSEGNLPLVEKSDGEPVLVQESEPLRAECQHFLDCSETRTSPKTDGAEGLRVLRVLDAAQVSLEQSGASTSLGRGMSSSPDFFSHPTAVVDKKANVGRGTKIWHFSHVSDNASLGEDCNLGQNVFIASNVRIGRNVKIQNNVSVYTGTTIEDDVFLGPSCVLTNVSNPRSQVVRRGIYEKTIIRKGATVGANATVVCGKTLGRYCFISAGSVVTKDVPDYGLVMGVPGKQVGWMSRHGHVLSFGKDGHAVCPESGLSYQIHSSEKPDSHQWVTCVDVNEDADLSADSAVGTKEYKSFKE